MALVLPGTALAATGQPADESTRFNITARGDGFFFQVDGDEIPASPTNDAGSATASVITNNSGGSKSFAGAPYFGNTAQTLPGTINGVPNQFGAGQLQIPFSQFPGYVAVNSTGETKAQEEGQFYRVSAEALQASGKASAFYGAPSAFPAPNQQQTATAGTESKGSEVVASALGSSQGVVVGPVEVANSTAMAAITQVAGQEPKIESKSFGRFSVAGQDFGFDQKGFRYLGQEMSSADAIAQANSVLMASNTKLELVPVVQEKTASGGTSYTIGGLRITTTQASPSGAGNFTFGYTIGRASVSADVAKLGFAVTPGSASNGTVASLGSVDLGSADRASVKPSVPTKAPRPDTRTVNDAALSAASTDLPRAVAALPAGPTRGENTEWLYAMLLLSGVALLGAPFLFSRFAVADKS